MAKSIPALSVVMPAYNEEDVLPSSIAEAVEVLEKLCETWELVIVDDGSKDATPQIVADWHARDPRVRAVRQEPNQGYTKALIRGFSECKYEAIFYTDADAQFDLSEIAWLYPHLAEHDMVCGFRDGRKDPPIRLLTSFVYNFLQARLLGIHVRDVNCAFKLFRKSFFDKVKLDSDGFIIDAELYARAKAAGLTWKQVGVTHRPREMGNTTVKVSTVTETLRELWGLGRMLDTEARAAGEPHAIWKPRYLWIVGALTVLHAVLAALLPLSGDEAYYWACSRNLDWSYFDQPPLVIWSIIPFRWLFGEVALAVRAPAIVASVLMAVFLLPMARRLGGTAREATFAYLLLHAMPLYFFGSFYESTDVGMATAYVAAGWAAVALAQGEKRAWWGFGIACGLGFLAKFPVVLVAPALIPALLRPDVRRHLLGATPWLALIVSLLLTAPVWIWGALNNWDNILFQIQGRHRESEGGLSQLLEYLAANALFATPFLLAAMGLALWTMRRRFTDPGWRAFAIAGVMPLLTFGLIAMRTKIGLHWGAPSLVLGVLAVTLLPIAGKRALVTLGAISGLALSLVLTAAALSPRLLMGVDELRDGLARVLTEPELAAEIRARARPGETIVSDSYSMVHVIDFLNDGQLDVALAHVGGGRHGLASLYWRTAEEWTGKDVLFVTAKQKPAQRERAMNAMRERFTSCSDEPPIRIRHEQRVVREVHVLRCESLAEPVPAFSRKGASSLDAR